MGRVVLHLPGGGGDEKPYVCGTYVGDGTAERLIPIGFEPSAVSVLKEGSFDTNLNASSSVCSYGGFSIAGKPAYTDASGSSQRRELLRVSAGGFIVFNINAARSNENASTFYYIAFR